MYGKELLTDRWGRPLRDLRVSVTDRCNFRCRYCMPEEVFGPDYPFLSGDKILSFEEITRLVRIFVSLGVKKVRITGGEPLLRKDLPVLIRMIKNVEGIEDLALTTNASLLGRHAKALKKAGLDRINVSLDALDEDVFARMNGNRSSVKRVLAGIEAAARVKLPVKVNMVVQKGVNDREILPMARYFRNSGHTLRLIEFMDVGNSNGWDMDQVVPKSEMVETIHREMPLEPAEARYYGEVASRFRYRDGGGEIGVISSVTETFCSTCTRARLSADGHLYTCLFASKGSDLRTLLRSGADDGEIAERIRRIWGDRRDRYSEERLHHTPRRDRKKVEMSYIGG